MVAFNSPEIASLGAGILAMHGLGKHGCGFEKKLRMDVSVFETDYPEFLKYEQIYEKYKVHEKLIIKR